MQNLSSSPVLTGDPAAEIAARPAWLRLKTAVEELRPFQSKDGSIDLDAHGADSRKRVDELVATVTAAVRELAPSFPHDAAYLDAVVTDLARWADSGYAVPDFLDSLLAFQPAGQRQDGLGHLVVFPMYTQNGNPDRNLEAVLLNVVWPDWLAELERTRFDNPMFVPITFTDFTSGYDTNSAVLFPETVAVRQAPERFTWGGIFCDREAVRFRAVSTAAVKTLGLEIPADAARLLEDQELAQQTFVLWDLVHDRTHSHGDLPFDPFMIKQRSPFWMYGLEELRCDLTAFREATRIRRASDTESDLRDHAELVQYAIIFDRIFRFPLTGSRVRNYDGLGGQLLFAWLHQHHVLHWTDTQLTIDWDEVPDVVIALSDAINDLYWASIDRPKMAHWLAAYGLVSETLTPNPASRWAVLDLPLEGPAKLLTDAVMDDEFPLSMFYEALSKKMTGVIDSTAGITAKSA